LVKAKDILCDIYVSKEIKEVVNRLRPEHLREDILQHCFTELFSKQETFILDLYHRGKLKAFIVKMLYNTSVFNDTPFCKEWNLISPSIGREIHVDRFKDVPEDDSTDMVDEVVGVVNDLYWYKRDILKLYAELGTYKEVSEATGIPVTSIHNTIKDARNEVTKKIHA
jgi:DNA-directed RNA polymerase specialized sigma24 family protein